MSYVPISLVLVLAILSTFSDATSQETLTLRIFDPDNRPSDDKLAAMLKKADLESHGYTRELTTKLVSDSGSDKPTYQKAYLYYKIVDCSRVQEIIQELETLGVFPLKLATKINGEIKARNVSNMKQCKVGLELHFKDGGGCPEDNSQTGRKKRAALRPCLVCVGSCGRIEASS